MKLNHCDYGCDEATGNCIVPDACEDGETKCEKISYAKMFFTCVGDHWDSGEYCYDICDDELGCICEEGDWGCDGITLTKCIDGEWEDYYDCDFDCSWGECIDPECSPNGATRCTEDESGMQTCEDGRWGGVTMCQGTCSGGSCP